jgi:hypothetical protein
VVLIISLPDINLPPLSESQELDILADILGDETKQINDEFPEERPEDPIARAESPEEAQVAAGVGHPVTDPHMYAGHTYRGEDDQLSADHSQHGYQEKLHGNR